MPELSEETTLATAYLPAQLYEAWKEEAGEQDLKISKYIVKMVEAGRKQVDVDSFAVESMQGLRAERDTLRREVERERARVRELESQLERTARADIVGFIEANPGATAPEIIQHVADSVPGRTVGLLDSLEGTSIREEEGEYIRIDEEAADARSEEGSVPGEGIDGS